MARRERKDDMCARAATATRSKSAEFVFKPARSAKKVFVAGSFNGWKLVPMTKLKDGGYSAAVTLSPGTYEYKFVVDGQWVTDPKANWAVPNPYGSMNSVVKVD